MKALKFVEPKRFEYIEMDVPRIEENQLRIKIKVAGICHSDVLSYAGKHPYRIPPVVTGHEFCGVVDEVGKNAFGDFHVGDRVVVEPHIGCGVCYYCKSGHYNLCVDKRLIGVKDWTGCFAEYVAVFPSMCFHMPYSMSYEEGALFEPYCVGQHAVEMANLPAGSSVAVLGCGTIGMMTITSAFNHEMGIIIGTDVSEYKCNFAINQGAIAMFNPIKDNIAAEILKMTNGVGVDCVFIDVSVPNILDQAFQICRKNGTIVIVASFDEPVKIDLKNICQRHVMGSNMYTAEDYKQAMKQFQSGKLCLKLLVTRQISFLDAGTMIHDIAEGKFGDEIKIVIKF